MGQIGRVMHAIKTAGLEAKAALLKGIDRQSALENATANVAAQIPDNPLVHFIASFGLAWLECGFPTVDVDARLAASLMCTRLPRGMLAEVRQPWRCFCVRIPSDLLSTGAENIIVLERRDGQLGILRIGEEHGVLGEEPSLAEYAGYDLDDVKTELPEGAVPDEALNEQCEQSRRDVVLIGRLIIGICIEMDAPTHEGAKAAGPKHPRGRNARGEPASWIFRTARPVSVDLRTAVREYASGARGGALSMQHLVRGHHKKQACGPGLSERKWIHVEPYWRGDPDAPIALRAHNLKRSLSEDSSTNGDQTVVED